jgi:hypothetical protein
LPEFGERLRTLGPQPGRGSHEGPESGIQDLAGFARQFNMASSWGFGFA